MDPRKCNAFFSIGFILCAILFELGSTQGYSSSGRRNLSCYYCHTLTHGDLCQQPNFNIQMVTSDLPMTRQCATDDRHCIVRRHSYALNSSGVKVWMMERNCSKSCTNECIISLYTGDRMKLYLCTSCCQSNLCNVDNGANANLKEIAILLLSFLSLTVHTNGT